MVLSIEQREVQLSNRFESNVLVTSAFSQRLVRLT